MHFLFPAANRAGYLWAPRVGGDAEPRKPGYSIFVLSLTPKFPMASHQAHLKAEAR
jgi:hypothetical protein